VPRLKIRVCRRIIIACTMAGATWIVACGATNKRRCATSRKATSYLMRARALLTRSKPREGKHRARRSAWLGLQTASSAKHRLAVPQTLGRVNRLAKTGKNARGTYRCRALRLPVWRVDCAATSGLPFMSMPAATADRPFQAGAICILFSIVSAFLIYLLITS